ncbi:MAG: flagellar biosynthesis protein FlhB [Bacillota bacterium]|nr:flagellar biosynthesis protein FlhB [Bacillota bacterium]
MNKLNNSSSRNNFIGDNDQELKLNLQLFAQGSGDRTEKATPKKRKEAREKGQVLKSREITSAMLLLAIFVSVRLFGGYIYNEIAVFLKNLLTNYANTSNSFTISTVAIVFGQIGTVLFKTTAPILGIALITALMVEYAQVGFLFTVKTLGFKFNRINPISGFKRVFSMRSVVELLKSIIKIIIVAFVAYSYIQSETRNILNLMNLDVMSVAIYIGTTALNVAIRICIVLIILAAFDYGYQWWDFEKGLKMTKQEVKEEYKQLEGNPEIKSKIRQKQRQISMRRMLQDVPKADVVITNPTHFAVAVKYDEKVSAAPVVIAKGQDFIAMRIKEVARENNVEIVENRPLARTLYDTVDIGKAIPPELYQAVAEVLAFVYSLKGKGKAG